MPQKISIITPLHFQKKGRSRHSSKAKRLEDCIHSLCYTTSKDILVSTNYPALLLQERNTITVEDIQKDHNYSPGSARNNAIFHTFNKMIFIVDVDLIAAPSLSEQLHSRSNKCEKESLNAFEMYPCLYLTKEETERFDGDFQGCLESFLRGENHRVEGIALASSCLLLNREWFLQLGGFDERFVGHGGEDLELIDRLCQHYPIGPRPADYGLNIKAQHPGDYQGSGVTSVIMPCPICSPGVSWFTSGIHAR